jgi:DNA invertase Pin-like site-specific DNA recombinase
MVSMGGPCGVVVSAQVSLSERASTRLLDGIEDVEKVTGGSRQAVRIGDLQDIVRTVRARGAVLKATEQPIDTGTAAGKCFLDMLGVFAEFETNLRRERQLEGIAKAKAAGVYKGRPPSIEAARVRELKARGMRPVDIAKALQIGRASVYRVLGQKADH